MKPTMKPKQDWKKQFDETLEDYEIIITSKHPNSDDNDIIKSFISSLLLSQRKEVIEECIKLLPKKIKVRYSSPEADSVSNQMIDEIKSILNKLK